MPKLDSHAHSPKDQHPIHQSRMIPIVNLPVEQMVPKKTPYIPVIIENA
jgi:hypothetical protein